MPIIIDEQILVFLAIGAGISVLALIAGLASVIFLQSHPARQIIKEILIFIFFLGWAILVFALFLAVHIYL